MISSDANARGYVRSLSGIKVGWDGPIPPVADFVVQLGRIPRFAGATVVPWSVLGHCYFCNRLACRDYKNRIDVSIACLIHDFGEILTGDIPSPFKNPEIKPKELRFVELLWKTWFCPDGSTAFPWKEVKEVDQRALNIEGGTLVRGAWESPSKTDLDLLMSVLQIQSPTYGQLHRAVEQRLCRYGAF